jgi:acyl-CoA synthetase (AMP-forming)/AMP-acid ligase II
MLLLNSGQVLTERAKIDPQVEAVVDTTSGARFDFRRLNERTNQTANTLLGMGLGPGERIACLMSNQPQYVESFYACAKAGFVFVALNWRLTVPELSYQLLDCGATAILYGADQQPLVDALRQQFPKVRWLAADEGDYAAAVARAATAEPPIGATGADPLYMMYTSGTTGRPKGAVMSHSANLAWLTSMLATSDLRMHERNIVVAPLFHIGGLGLVMSAVYRGMTSVLLKAFDPGVMWDLIDAEKITGFFAVPAMLAFMHQHPKRATAARPALRWVLCGAAPVPVTLIESYLTMGVEILQVYGLTETHGGICLMSAEHARRKVGSTGMPYFGIDVRVVDKAGNPVPPGLPGEVVTRGPHLISGYWNQPEATREAIREGWFHTGDIAEVDADGFIYIKDRSKDMVISGGENVYPAEVEDVLSAHSGVREVGVIGQPSAKWGESTCAVVVRGDGWKGDDELLVRELQALAQTRLARFKQPRTYVFVSALPRNPSGKILKRLLREQFPGPAPE